MGILMKQQSIPKNIDEQIKSLCQWLRLKEKANIILGLSNLETELLTFMKHCKALEPDTRATSDNKQSLDYLKGKLELLKTIKDSLNEQLNKLDKPKDMKEVSHQQRQKEKLRHLNDVGDLIKQQCYLEYLQAAMSYTRFGEAGFYSIFDFDMQIFEIKAAILPDFSKLDRTNNKLFNESKKRILEKNWIEIARLINLFNMECIDSNRMELQDRFYINLRQDNLLQTTKETKQSILKNDLTPHWKEDFEAFINTRFLGCKGITKLTDILNQFLLKSPHHSEESIKIYEQYTTTLQLNKGAVQEFVVQHYKPTAMDCQNSETSIEVLTKKINNLRFLLYKMIEQCNKNHQASENIADQLRELKAWENTLRCALMMLFVSYVKLSIPTDTQNEIRRAKLLEAMTNNVITIWGNDVSPSLEQQQDYLNENQRDLVIYYNELIAILNSGMLIWSSASYGKFISKLQDYLTQAEASVGFALPKEINKLKSFADVFPDQHRFPYFISDVVDYFCPEYIEVSSTEKKSECTSTGAVHASNHLNSVNKRQYFFVAKEWDSDDDDEYQIELKSKKSR